MNKIKNCKSRLFLSALFFSAMCNAQGRITLRPPGDGGILDRIVGWFQYFINLTTGPGALIIGVVLIIAGGGMMMLDPRATWLMLIFKIIGILVIILNIGLIIAALTF